MPRRALTAYFSAMTEAYAIVLKDRGIVEVAGSDAASFLQGLITNDISKVGGASGIYAALLTPQGKIIYDFLISATPDGYLLDVVAAYASDLANRLKKYKLRAKVTVADRSAERIVVALPPGKPARLPEPNILIADPRLPELGHRAILTATTAEADFRACGFDLKPQSEYTTLRLSLGVPDAAVDIPPETLFPLDCNFEELHGVDFTKGCYVGQELTSRMKHRASARRRLLPVSAASSLPAAGTLLKLHGIDIGELRGTFATKGMASIRLDRLGNAKEANADGIAVEIGRPFYPLILTAGNDHP
ncbi:MAG: folate-binding protein [Alphaproteobacteria bacterium]|nr:folate-binding protein [Alphaproteobacteria bacterium]